MLQKDSSPFRILENESNCSISQAIISSAAFHQPPHSAWIEAPHSDWSFMVSSRRISRYTLQLCLMTV